MMSVMVWKEYREHRMVWIALAFLGAVTLLSRPILMAAGWQDTRPDWRVLLCEFAVMVVGVYALICGAMMLAGERENGTLPYLDALPGLRRRVWQSKFAAGVLLVLMQIAFLMSLSAAVSQFEHWWEAAWTLAAMLVAGLWGLAWGMLFSSFGDNVVNVILQSLGGQTIWTVCIGLLAGFVGVLIAALFGFRNPIFPDVLAIGLFAVTPPAALVGSALVFTHLDRRRLRAASESMPQRKRVLHPSWPKLFWLAWRQTRGFAAGMAIFALFLGFVTLANSLILWPVATLLIGVLCGATAFADEQQGPFRFLGDQGFPLGRLWLVKVGLRFGVAVAAALLVLAPCFVRALTEGPDSQNYPNSFSAHLFQSDLVLDLIPPGLFLTMWLLYGFGAGCLFGLLFRHGLAAGVFALFTGTLAAVLWVPSLLSGGLHAWQVVGPPLLVLCSSPLLMRPWAAGRIASWTTAIRLTPFVVLAALWIAGGLWYRILEIPDAPMKVDLEAFCATLPTPSEAEGGELFHSACLRFNALRRSLESQQAPQGAAAPAMPAAAPAGGVGAVPPGQLAPPGGAAPAPSPMEQATETLEHGWPVGDKALKVWLDKMYEGEWVTMLKKAADLPTGPFDDVRNATQMTPIPATQWSRDVATVLVARGLGRQAAGDDDAFIENLRIGYRLSRSLRDRTPAIDVVLGRVIDGKILLKGLDRWLEKLHGRPVLIRQALDLLSRQLQETANDDKDVTVVADLMAKNTADLPLGLLEEYISKGYYGQHGRSYADVGEEANVVATAGLIPWERARQARILRLVLADEPNKNRWLYGPDSGYGWLPYLGHDPPDINRFNAYRKCEARAMQLKLALRWYQADNGKPADNLDALVPKYLPSIPLDPYDGKPFRYRLSHGEEIEWPPAPDAAVGIPMGAAPAAPGAMPAPGAPIPAVAPDMRKIPPGQGILWSVGQDGIDNGGHRQTSSSRGETAPGEDIIFLVPLPHAG